MKSQFLKQLVLGSALTSLVVFCVAAQEASTGTAPASSAATAAAAKSPSPSGPISDILKLLDAGVSKDIIKAYVEKTLAGYQPTAADIITLKQHGVTDDVTAMLLTKAPEVAATPNPAASLLAQPVPVAENALPSVAAPTYVSGGNSGYLDPEGYNYFQYYYLYPRTLAWANQQLNYGASPSPSFYYGNNGYYAPLTFGPYPPSVFAHPRSGVRIGGAVRVVR
jgi:hypothetical protein